jgi:uncharacterized protein YkwD
MTAFYFAVLRTKHFERFCVRPYPKRQPRKEQFAGAKPRVLKRTPSGCRSEVILRVFPLSLVVIILFLSSVAMAQASDGRVARAILVDVIGSRQPVSKTSLRETPASSRAVPTSASDVERRAFELTNAERQASGLRFLMWDESLARLARFHSRNMAEDHFFSHRSPDGEMVDDRANKLGIVKWIGIGENIAYLNGYADPATIAVGKWMKSPLHKQNILNGQWQASAIGAAIDKDGKIYLTQVFIMR